MEIMLLNITKYISNMSIVDIIFFCMIMVLIILIVVLINTIKNDSLLKAKIIEESNTKNQEEVKSPLEEKITKASNDEPLDLVSIAKEINENPTSNIDLTNYEKEQEEKAIISYDELIKARNNYEINYIDEDLDDGLLVKKVNLNNLTTEVEDKKEDVKVNVFLNYEHEEAFLQALKKLKEMLNN